MLPPTLPSILPGLAAVSLCSLLSDVWLCEVKLEILSGFYSKIVWVNWFLLRQSSPYIICLGRLFGIPSPKWGAGVYYGMGKQGLDHTLYL
jgi:hypothetical protein